MTLSRIVLLRAALGHSDASITQWYLEVGEEAVEAAIRGCDFTRGLRGKRNYPARAPGVDSLTTAA